MPTAPYAILEVSVDGGAAAAGGATASSASTLDFTIQDTTLITAQRFEIYDYPAGFAQPAGWSVDADGVYYYTTDFTPPTVTAPATPMFGKLMCRLTCNNKIDPTGAYDSGLVDEATAVSVVSPAGLVDIGELEEDQFETTYIEVYQDNLRTLESYLRANSTFRSIDGCLLHYAGDIQSPYGTVIDDAAGRYSTIANIGSRGGTFNVAAGNARPLVQMINARRVVQFDPADDFHESSLASGLWQPMHDVGTVVVVCRPSATSGVILDTLGADNNNNTGLLMFEEATQNLTVRVGNGTGTFRFTRTTVAAEMAYGVTHMIVFRFDPAEATEADLRIDFASVHNAALVGAADANAPTGTLCVGRFANAGASFFDGYIMEAAFYDTYLTLAEVIDLEDAMRTKHSF